MTNKDNVKKQDIIRRLYFITTLCFDRQQSVSEAKQVLNRQRKWDYSHAPVCPLVAGFSIGHTPTPQGQQMGHPY